MKRIAIIVLIVIATIAMVLFKYSSLQKADSEVANVDSADRSLLSKKSGRRAQAKESEVSPDSASTVRSQALSEAINRADVELFRSLMVQNKEATLSLLSELANESNQTAVHTLLYNYSYEQGDWLDALNSLNHFESLNHLHVQLMADFIHEYAKVNYLGAGQWLSANTEERGYPSAAESLGRFTGANSERVQLLELLSDELSDENLKSAYYKGFFEEWIKQDMYEALTYINEMPASSELDATIHEFVVGTGALLDPDVMMSWAKTIFDEKLKASAVRHATEALQFR